MLQLNETKRMNRLIEGSYFLTAGQGSFRQEIKKKNNKSRVLF